MEEGNNTAYLVTGYEMNEEELATLLQEPAAYIAREIKSVFEHNIQLRSVGIFKGSRLILTTRRHLASSRFKQEFIKLWRG